MDKHERKCQVCGWDKIHPITGEPPLHVHHIDGDATNNSEDNLQLLCPNCHSLKAGKFTVESREYDILDGTCTVILDQQITWAEHPQEHSDAMLAYRKRWNNTIDLSCKRIC